MRVTKNRFNKIPSVDPNVKSLHEIKNPLTPSELTVNIGKIKDGHFKRKLTKNIIIAVAGVSTVVGLTASYVDNYITGNTGCFFHSGDSTCKVHKLSCCNFESSQYIENCSEDVLTRVFNKEHLNACNGYANLNNEECCEKCDCSYHNCEKGESMTCHRASVGEALTYFVNNVSSSIVQEVYDILSSSIFIKIFLIGFVIIVIALIGYKFI